MAHTPLDGMDTVLTDRVKNATAEEMLRLLRPIHGSTNWARVSARIGVNYKFPKDIDTIRTVYYAALMLGYGTKMHIVEDPGTPNSF